MFAVGVPCLQGADLAVAGFLDVADTLCRVIPTTWEWGEDIDVARAMDAKRRAEEKLAQSNLDEISKVKAEARLYRALVRIHSAGKLH